MSLIPKDRKSLTTLLDSLLKLAWQPKSGTLLSPSTALLQYISHEPVQGEQRTYFKLLTSAGAVTLPPVEKPTAVFFSPSRGKRLIVREKEEKTQVVVELWDSERLYAAKDLKTTHQNFINTAVFGTVAWSHSEDRVAYIAERKETKAVSFWSEEGERAGEQFVYKENYGERHEDIGNPGLFVMDTRTAEVKEIQVPKEVAPAQPCFHPGKEELVFVGFTLEPYKRGIAAMTNRESRLFTHNLSTSVTEPLVVPFSSCLYPVFSPAGKFLAYFGFPPALSHTSCGTLSLVDWDSKQARTVIDVIREPRERFSGIYGYHETLMKLAWVSESKLVFQSVNKCNSGVFTVEIDSGDVQEVEFGLERPWSAEVMDVLQGMALLKCSNFKTFPQVFLCDLTNIPQLSLLDGHIPPSPLSPTQQQFLSTLQSVQITSIPHKNSPAVSTLYWTTADRPLAVIIHGGPHGNGTADYTTEGAMLTAIGINVLVVNYRGSTGLGQDALQALLGHIGYMDVDDVTDAIHCAGEHVNITPAISIGGSHGGFLSAHLSSTGLVQASVIKNGVTDLSSMSLTTDITDWGSAEVLASLTTHPHTSEEVGKLYEASPISRAGKVAVPVLIIAGGSDKRVPCAQSVEMYRVLKARGQDVKMLWYPKDGHALMTPASGYDYLLNEVLWITEKLGL